jgi:hypothetical protein
MKKFTLIIVATAVISALLLPKLGNASDPSQITSPPRELPHKDDLIRVTSLTTGAAVTSPLTVEGIARGSWYFEARFPVELRNSKGTVIAQTVAEAKGDWMTTNYVRFSATLNFSPQPAGSAGMLVLKKDNPSGLPQNGNELDIPIAF